MRPKLKSYSFLDIPLASSKRVSNRHRAFHFCEWAVKHTLAGKKVTIKSVYQYMSENMMVASDWHAQKLKKDWLEYRALFPMAPLHQEAIRPKRSYIRL